MLREKRNACFVTRENCHVATYGTNAEMSDFTNYQSNLEGMPQTQMMMFVTALPPPPPPAPAPLQTAAPPPPPPAEPVLASVGTLPNYAGPQQSSSGLFTMSQVHPPLPAEFDASRPPPPVMPSSIKRPMDPISAGPNKIRKEDSKLPDAPCENCVQREIRIDFYKQQMYRLHCEDEYQTLVYKKKLEEYEHGRDILRAMVGPDLFRFLDEYIEGTPQVQDILAQFHQSSFLPGTSTVPRQLLLQLMEYVARSEVETAPVRLDETTLLQTLLRRSSSIGRTPSPDRVHSVSVLEMLRNTTTTQIESLSESGNEVARTNQNVIRYTNGLKESGPGSSASAASRYPPTTSTAMRPYARGSALGPAGGYVAPPPPVRAPPAPYTLFFPPGPPLPTAPRPYYSQPYGPSPTINPPFPNVGYSSRMSAPGPPQMPMRPPSSSYNEYMMARYPHPPEYYPPFQ